MGIKVFSLIFVGLGWGVAVGSGFVAFLAVLGVIPRLMQLSKTNKYVYAYEWAVVLGAIFGSTASLNEFSFHLSPYYSIPIGLFCGMFIGLLAAALTEVLNVFPIFAKRIGVHEKIIFLMMALMLGKIFGSLFQWIYYVDL